jgi:hypothetical protein
VLLGLSLWLTASLASAQRLDPETLVDADRLVVGISHR